MIEILSDFPDHVVAVTCGGTVTKAEYQAKVIPAVKNALARNKKLRVYCEIGANLAKIEAGALLADLKFGLRHYFRWERMAIVAPNGGLRQAIGFLRFLIPAKIKIFSVSETPDARAWITAP
jgi:hypothetical protein